MIKKVIIGLLLVLLAGVLIWGGVIRTLAKNDDGGSQGYGQNNRALLSSNVEGSGRGKQQSIENSFEEATQRWENQQEIFNENQDHAPQIKQQGNASNQNYYRDNETNNQNSGNGRRGRGNGNSSSRDPLTSIEIEALMLALDDEYKALATYLSVLSTFGDVDPFVNIAHSEQRHIDALINQFNKYSIPVPENTWIGSVPQFDSVADACQAGVDAEIANADLYEMLFLMTERADLLRVFTNLQTASQNSHLPEFEACN